MNKPILLYLLSSKFTPQSVKKAESSGYVVIGVNTFDEVKVIDTHIVAAGVGDPVSKAAFKAIAETTSSLTKEKFAQNLAVALK